MDGHALAASDEADDRITRDRTAAFAEADQQIAHALDPDAAGPFEARWRSDRGKCALDVIEDPQPHDDLLGADRTVPDGRIEIVDSVVVVLASHVGDRLEADGRDRRPGQPAQFALERFAAMDDVLVAVLALEPLPDLLASMACSDDIQPVARRAVLALGRHDLDDVAVLQPVVQGHQPVVDLGPDRAVTDIGVDPIGEIERCRASRQVLDVAFRGEHEDLVLEDVELDALHELGRIRFGHVALPVHELAQPGQLGVVLAVGLRAFLVSPVRGDPDLAHLVHLVGPDLDLEGLAVEGDDRRMERLVQIVLGDRDVVVELAGDRSPDGMDDAQGRVAIADLVNEQPDRVDVVDLAELGTLALHLLPDAVDMFRPTLDVGHDPGCLETRSQFGDGPLDVGLAAGSSGIQQSGQVTEAFRLERLEGEVLEFPLDLPDPEPLGEWRVDLHRLASDALLLVDRQGRQRAHVVEPVGQLDQDDPDVLSHRQQHLADVLGLLLFMAVGAEFGQLGDAVHQVGDLGPEILLDGRKAVLGVLGCVVQQRRLDGRRVEPELGQDLGGRDRMDDIWLAGRSLLAGMRLDRPVECPSDGFDIGIRMLGKDRRVERLPERFDVDVAIRRHRGHGRHAARAPPGGPGRRRLRLRGRAGHRAKHTLSRSPPCAMQPRPRPARPSPEHRSGR